MSKIIIVGTAFPYRGGLAAYNERIAREFIAQGHDVEIETFSLQYPSFLFPGKTQYSSDPEPSDLHIRRGLNSINPFSWIKIGRRIRKSRPDLVLIKFWIPYMAPCLGTVARIAKRGGRTKVVTILDNLIPHEKRPGDSLFIKYFCGSVDRYVAMSRSVLADIDKFDTRKPRTFSPHPLYDNFGQAMDRDEACRKLGIEDKINLLFFGFIRDYKGLDLLIEAFASLDPQIRGKVNLIVAGEFYSDSSKYHTLAQERNVDNEIIWKTDFIPDDEVKSYFSCADLIVQPYKTATQSGVTQIAYHFEKPMLVTRVGGLSEIVPDGKSGYVVEPDSKSIADALLSFIDRRPDFTEGIRDEKKKYSWKKMTDVVLSSEETI